MKKINVIVTAGGMSEKIDNVRKITNSSTGKLGVKITEELLLKDNIDKIYYICSKNSLKPVSSKVQIVEINGVRDLYEKVVSLLKNQNIDIFIHSMAVSDYYVSYVSTVENISNEIDYTLKDPKEVLDNPIYKLNDRKISSNEDNLIIALKKAPKIISLIKDISPSTLLVGFKLLDGVSHCELIDVAKKLRDKNKCNFVVANDLNEIRQGKHHAYIIDRDDNTLEVSSKEEIAKCLVKKILE